MSQLLHSNWYERAKGSTQVGRDLSAVKKDLDDSSPSFEYLDMLLNPLLVMLSNAYTKVDASSTATKAAVEYTIADGRRRSSSTSIASSSSGPIRRQSSAFVDVDVSDEFKIELPG